MATRLWSIVFDANDPAALARFWSETLGWPTSSDDGYELVAHPDGMLPRLEFVGVREPKTSKNRIHFDLATESKDEQQRTVERLIALGADRVDIGQPDDVRWVVLGDPGGNEFCVVDLTGVPKTPETGPIAAINHDAHRPDSMARFWSQAIGWPIIHTTDMVVVLRSPNNLGPILCFASGPGAVADKPAKNRLHLDVAPLRDDNQHDDVDRLVALGARRVDIGQGDVPWIVMADPEDNEFCVLTPR